MNILHISALPVWPLAGKGGMPSLAETLRGHVRAGHEITLVLPKHPPLGIADEVTQIPPDTGYAVHHAEFAWVPYLKAFRRSCHRLLGAELPFLLRWVLNLLTCLMVTVSLVVAGLHVRCRRRKRFDLVYAHNQYAAPAGLLLRLMFGLPNVTRLYGTFLAELMSRRWVWLRYPVAAAGYLVPHSLLICGNDGTWGDRVAEKLGIDLGRFRFWQNGVDMPAAPPKATRASLRKTAPENLRPDSTWVVSCSRLSYWKRIDRLIRAVHAARDAGADCQLIVAGDGPERLRLARLADELGVGDEIVWLGAVAHDEIWAWMNVADVFIIANDVTNRCNPLYEAICAHLPVVSVRHPSTADLLSDGDNALLAEPDDVRRLGEHLAAIARDGALQKRLRRAQQSVAESFWTWEERMNCEVRELESLVAAG